MQEDDDHDHHEQKGFEERVHHRFNGMAHEHRRVIHDGVVDAFREAFLQLIHRPPNVFGELDGIGARGLEDRQRHGGFVVQERAQRVAGSAQFDARHVLEQDLFPVVAGLHDDLAKLLGGHQPALGIDLQLEIDRPAHRLLADGPGGDLYVLFADRVDHVARGEVPGRNGVRVQPYAHGVIAGAEDLHVAGTGYARQDILHLQRGVIAEINLVVTIVGRKQVHHHREVGRLFDGGHAEPPNLLRQFGKRLRDPVLHLHLRLVNVGPEFERHGQGHHAVARRLRKHVERILDAIDRLLERRRDRFGDGLRVRPGIGGAHDNGGRNDFRIFAHGQPPHRDESNDENHEGEHTREYRTTNKKVGEVHMFYLIRIRAL